MATVCASATDSVRITPSTTQRSRYSPSGSTTPARCRRLGHRLTCRSGCAAQVAAGSRPSLSREQPGRSRHQCGRRINRGSWLLSRVALGRVARTPRPPLLRAGRLPSGPGQASHARHPGHRARCQRAHHLAGLEEAIDEGVDLGDFHPGPGDPGASGAVDDLGISRSAGVMEWMIASM